MNTAPTTYAIRVHGHLDYHWSDWLGELDMTHEDNGTTIITASIADQAQLHGLLAGLRDIGAVITDLRTTDPAHRGACRWHPRRWRRDDPRKADAPYPARLVNWFMSK